MRILFVTPFYYPEFRFGGPPRKIHAIAGGLLQRGHDARVLTFDHSDCHSRVEKKIDGVAVRYLPWMGRGLRQVPFDVSAFREEICDAQVIHCYGLYTALVPIASGFSRSDGKPIVQEPLGMYPARGKNRLIKGIYNLLITRWLLRAASVIIAASKAEAHDLEQVAPANKIFFRRNGIDVSAFTNVRGGEHLRERWGIPQDDKLVLFLGRLSPIKNLEQLILAFVRAEVPHTQLLLVGPSEPAYEPRLRSLIARDNLSARVHLPGPVYEEDQQAALAAADLVVLSSLNESFGNAAGEAVAAGIPVLLTDTCGIAPLIHRRAGLAVPLGLESLAEGLRTMLDPEKRQQFLQDREAVKKELSWDEPIRQTEALYERIIRNGDRGAGNGRE